MSEATAKANARVGVLALQGDFDAHVKALSAAGALAVEVRRCRDLAGLDGLVIPGGESTTLLNLMADEPWFAELAAFHRLGGALFGTCAGAILLSKEVRHPEQPSLGLLDAVIERNAYGRQVDSFVAALSVPELAQGGIEAVFIRAPRIVQVGAGVRVLARHQGNPVLVVEGRVMAATFHPELTGSSAVHEYFLEVVSGKASARRTGSQRFRPVSHPQAVRS